jgi:squalene-hopene/tetraprenyl-beta-curcumene cyclase
MEGSGFRVQGSADGKSPGSKVRPIVEGPKSKVQSRIAEEVICEGVKFLVDSNRPDGSWPIDTNLATWNTTLAINALAGAGENVAELLGRPCLEWLLSCQHTRRHPFTGADPGGFGWTDLSGAVPDADDTPGALLALHTFGDRTAASPVAGQAQRWLLGLQNRDGGWPTFCRGWGRLPFDRSGTDLTAHALRAFHTWNRDLGSHRTAALAFLRARQHADGSWSPLWFGNQDHPDEDNPVYGTAKVLLAYRDLGLIDLPEAQRGIAWLVANQNADGGWGSGAWRLRARGLGLGARRSEPKPSPSPNPIPNPSPLQSSIEETALAIEALLAVWPSNTVETRNATEGVPYSISPPEPRTLNPDLNPCHRGRARLLDRVERDEHRQPAPIGFYFAKLWYYERLYPLTFTVAALGRARRLFARLERPEHSPSDAP